MRFLSLLLSVYILCLSAQQGLDTFIIRNTQTSCAKVSDCCEKDKSPVKKSHQDCNGTCNPFMICSTCPFIPGQSLQQEVSFVEFKQEFSIYNVSIPSCFLRENWHPPETIYQFES